MRPVGSIHRLVLAGAAPGLAPYYPSVGGTWDLDAAWPAYPELFAAHDADLRRLLPQPPQTNEVGRAAALVGGLLLLDERFGLPVRLFEIGASAGLNLRADRFRCTDAAGRGWGDPAAPVQLDAAWRGSPLPLERSPSVAERTAAIGSMVRSRSPGRSPRRCSGRAPRRSSRPSTSPRTR